MKLSINLRGNGNIIMPAGYNHLIQAFIYNHLGDKGTWLHEEGFYHEKRKFKLFCYSGILNRGRYDRIKKEFIFGNSISFSLSSPVEWIVQKVASCTILDNAAFLGKNPVTIESIEVKKSTIIECNSIRCRTLSPIEIHTTFKVNNKKKTYYYSPFEVEFSELINKNLQKKWKSFHGEDCRYNIDVKPRFNSDKRETIINYGGGDNKTVIKAWHGHFQLTGEPEFLQFALDSGLGGRNSQGFGLVEVIEDKEW